MPLLSIVMVVKNNSQDAHLTHKSLMPLYYLGIELVIQDYKGESKIEKNENIKLSNVADRSVSNAVNIALEKASGKYLMFWGAGELAIKEGMENSLKYLENHSPDILFNCIRLQPGNHIATPHPELVEQGMACLTPGAMISRELFLKTCGSLDERYDIANDYWMFTRMLRATKNWFVSDDVVVDFPMNGRSSTTHAFEGYLECELIRMREYGKNPVMAAIDMNQIVHSYLRQTIRLT